MILFIELHDYAACYVWVVIHKTADSGLDNIDKNRCIYFNLI